MAYVSKLVPYKEFDGSIRMLTKYLWRHPSLGETWLTWEVRPLPDNAFDPSKNDLWYMVEEKV